MAVVACYSTLGSMQRYLLVLLVADLILLAVATHGRPKLGDARTVDVIRSYKYNAEEYQVKTEDGYVIALTRIHSSGIKPPVLMVHGVIAASDQWVLRGPGQDLAFILVDQGHDVWLSDSRGNFYSRNHEFLTISDPEFWDYSFHEMGLYDLPAIIKKVLQESNHPQLYYVGHSMGSTMYYVLCSLKPEYNNVMKTAIHLAPIAFGVKKDMTLALQLLLNNVNSIADQLKKLNIYQFLPRISRNLQMVDYVCADANKALCTLLISQLYGRSTNVQKPSKVRSYLKRLVSGTSVKTMLHLAQIYKTKNFTMFDYGWDLNQELYSRDTPPSYPLARINSPVALFYGDNDAFIDDHSIQQLQSRLPNVITSVALPNYNHIDVLFAENSTKILYKKIVKLLSKS